MLVRYFLTIADDGGWACAAIAMRVEFVQSNVKLLNDRVLQSTSNRLRSRKFHTIGSGARKHLSSTVLNQIRYKQSLVVPNSLVTIDARADVHRSDFDCRRQLQLPNLRHPLRRSSAPAQRGSREIRVYSSSEVYVAPGHARRVAYGRTGVPAPVRSLLDYSNRSRLRSMR